MYRHVDGADNSPQNRLDGAPQAIALPELLQQHRLLTVAVAGFQRAHDVVDCVKQDLSDAPPVLLPLTETEEVVNEDVNVCQAFRLRWQGRV